MTESALLPGFWCPFFIMVTQVRELSWFAAPGSWLWDLFLELVFLFGRIWELCWALSGLKELQWMMRSRWLEQISSTKIWIGRQHGHQLYIYIVYIYIVYNIENTLKQCQISLVPCHFPCPKSTADQGSFDFTASSQDGIEILLIDWSWLSQQPQEPGARLTGWFR